MNTSELIIKARDCASACSPAIARLLEGMADALERLALADLIAYEAARSDIECLAVMEKSSWRSGSGNWYSVTGLRNDNGEQDYVNRAIAYLDSRGLIERDSDGLVRVLPERDAT